MTGKTKKIALMGMLLALTWLLAALESLLLPLVFLPPHVKPGLANVVTMYTAFSVGKAQAVLLALLKSAFVWQIRGNIAGMLSFCGGLLAIAVIILFAGLYRKKKRISYGTLSIAAALAHNLGQFAVASIILGVPLFYYLPVLIVSGVLMGALTGTILKVVMPVVGKLAPTTKGR